MVRYLKFLVAMMVTMFATSAFAYNPPASPKPAGNIVDLAHVLTPQSMGKLNAQINRINTTSANELGVLILPSLNGENIRDVGYTTARAWGVGKKDVDNGVMIVWSPGDRKIGIETGKGVEGDLPDLKANDIIRNIMGPEFRQQHYEAGLSRAFDAITQTIGDHRLLVAEAKQRAQQLGQNPTVPNPPPGNAIAAGGSPPQASTSHGCDVADTPGVNQAGFGGSLFLLLVVVGVWFFVRKVLASFRRQEQQKEAELQLLRQQRVAELERRERKRQEAELRQAAEDKHRAEEERARQPVVHLPPSLSPEHPCPICGEPLPHISSTFHTTPRPEPVHPVAVATVTTPTVDVAARIRQEQEELLEEAERQARIAREGEEARARAVARERQARMDEEARQERLARLDAERRASEAEEEAAAIVAAAAAAAVISSSDDDSNSGSDFSGGGSYSSDNDDSSSSNDSPDTDFGGGDFGGGGSADSY